MQAHELKADRFVQTHKTVGFNTLFYGGHQIILKPIDQKEVEKDISSAFKKLYTESSVKYPFYLFSVLQYISCSLTTNMS